MFRGGCTRGTLSKYVSGLFGGAWTPGVTGWGTSVWV